MQAAVRPYLNAGVALVGASAIAFAPIAPPLPDIEVPAVRSPAVTLTASALEAYAALLDNTLTNTGILANDLFEEGVAPILQQIIVNQLTLAQGLGSALENALSASNPSGLPALLETALGELASGQIQAAAETIATGVVQLAFPFLPSLLTPLNNLVAVVDLLPNIAVLGGLAAISPPLALLQSTGAAAQAVVDAIGSGDLGQAVNAIISAPAVMLDGLLNGYTPTQTAGLLTPGLGTVNILINIRDMILDAITPPAVATTTTTDAVTETTTDAATMVTLDVAPVEPADDATAVTEETAAADVTEEATVEEEAVAVDTVVEEVDEAGVVPAVDTDGADAAVAEVSDEVSDEDSATNSGATDLSDGNKVTPGDTNTTDVKGGSGTADADAETATGSTEAESAADAGSDNDAGSDDGGSSDDSGSSDSE